MWLAVATPVSCSGSTCWISSIGLQQTTAPRPAYAILSTKSLQVVGRPDDFVAILLPAAGAVLHGLAGVLLHAQPAKSFFASPPLRSSLGLWTKASAGAWNGRAAAWHRFRLRASEHPGGAASSAREMQKRKTKHWLVGSVSRAVSLLFRAGATPLLPGHVVSMGSATPPCTPLGGRRAR